jgi:hypothetical protein
MPLYEPDYPRLSYYWKRHHERYVRRMSTGYDVLVCQECGGEGVDCTRCEGTGFVRAVGGRRGRKMGRNERREAAKMKRMVLRQGFERAKEE